MKFEDLIKEEEKRINNIYIEAENDFRNKINNGKVKFVRNDSTIEVKLPYKYINCDKILEIAIKEFDFPKKTKILCNDYEILLVHKF